MTRKTWCSAIAMAGKRRVEVGGDHLLDGHEPAAVGQGHEPGQQRRHLDPGDALLAGRRVHDPQHQVEAQVGDVGERVALVDGQRREHREDGPGEDLVEVGPVVRVQRVPVGQQHAGAGQGRLHPVGEDAALAGHQLGHPRGDGRQLLGRAEAVRRPGPQAGRHLVLEARHPDLEELVEPLGEDGQELDPLEQGLPVVAGQVEQAVGELQPRQLAVGEPLGGLGEGDAVRHRRPGVGPEAELPPGAAPSAVVVRPARCTGRAAPPRGPAPGRARWAPSRPCPRGRLDRGRAGHRRLIVPGPRRRDPERPGRPRRSPARRCRRR